MRHARDEDLDRIEDLLRAIRTKPGLKERKRGVFYLAGRSLLHFHEDPAGMFADLGIGSDFERINVSTRSGKALFLRRLTSTLRDAGQPGGRKKNNS